MWSFVDVEVLRDGRKVQSKSQLFEVRLGRFPASCQTRRKQPFGGNERTAARWQRRLVHKRLPRSPPRRHPILDIVVGTHILYPLPAVVTNTVF